jgi:amino acid transporter
MATPAAETEGLKRELNVFDIAVSVLNITVGAGIFLLPALVAGILGNSSMLAYIFCGLLYFCIMLCYAEMSGRITNSGGGYVYIEKAFGSFAGFIANNLYWFCGVMLVAALSNGIADMLSVSFPALNEQLYRILLFIALMALLCYSNVTGVKQSMKVAKLLTLLKLFPLVLIVIVGLFQLNFKNLTWTRFPSKSEIGLASLILFTAFLGGETAATLGGEMKNPKRTGPLGILLGVISVIIFYILVHIVAQSSLGTSLATQKAPLAAVANAELGSWALQLLIVCGIISILGTIYSCIMAFSRVLFAGSFNNALPKYLSKIHPSYSTPYWSIITFSVIALILACTGGYRQLVVIATASMMLVFVGVVLALIKFKLTRNKLYPATGFKIPGGIIIPIIALITLGWFLSHSKRNEIIGISIFMSILIIIYGVKIFFAKKEDKALFNSNIVAETKSESI